MGAPLPEARPRFYKRNAFKAHSPIGRRLTRGARAQINVHNERKPQRFQAIVSGMDTASVAAERHFSPRKARALLHARARTPAGSGHERTLPVRCTSLQEGR